jgi:hypothetical protein
MAIVTPRFKRINIPLIGTTWVSIAHYVKKYLLESNFLGILTEALSANEKTIFAN